MPEIEELEIIRHLERLSRVEPTPQATRQAIQRALNTPESPACYFGSVGIVRALRPRWAKWFLPVAAAAAIMLAVHGLWPGHTADGLAWADVVRQIENARTVHLHMVTQAHTNQKRVGDIYLKAPDRMREESGLLSQITTIFNGTAQVIVNPARKLYQKVAAPSPLARENGAQILLQTFVCSQPQVATQQVSIMNRPCELVFDHDVEREGRQLHRYVLKCLDRTMNAGATAFFWFEADNRLALVTNERDIDGTRVETDIVTVALDVDLPDELFSIEKPEGYEDVGAGSFFANAGPDIRAIGLEYQYARERINRYRLVAWYTSFRRPFVAFRSMRDGQRWRIDKYGHDQTNVAMDADFDSIWQQLDQVVPVQLIMPFENGVASLLRIRHRSGNTETRAHSMSPDAVRDSHWRLEDLAWPEWPSDVPNVHTGPLIVYERLPDRPDRPGLIGIRAASNKPPNPQVGQSLQVFWIDPNKDYLCVRYELHVRKDQPWRDDLNWVPTEPEGKPANTPRGLIYEYDRVREVTGFAQTADGRWYPAAMTQTEVSVADGKRYSHESPYRRRIRVDTTGPVPDILFEWPTDAPKPQ